MLLEVDAKALEWRVAAQLSQDKTMIQEILDGADPHGIVRDRVFKNKVERVIAKQYNFRMIYADETSAAYAYHMDPQMPDLGKKGWERVVQSFLEHYSGLYRWHQQLYRSVCREGRLVGPTGRHWVFNKHKTPNGLAYKRAQVYNYPVQGTSADVIYLATKYIRQDIPNGVKLINCVHDSLIFDLPKKDLDKTLEVCYTVFNTLSNRISNYFGFKWSVPLGCEAKCGNNWSNMKEVEP